MVLRRRPSAQKKLCPRCGSPMSEIEGTKSCPACHYTTKDDDKFTTGIKISEEVMFKPIEEENDSPIKVYYMVQDEIVKTDCLDSDRACIVLDKVEQKIWIWKGEFASPGEVYRAGTAATRLKTAEKMYGAATQRIDEGNEPKDFPKIEPGEESVEKAPVKEPEPEPEPEPAIVETNPAITKPDKVEFEVAKINENKEIVTKKAEFDL